MQELPHIPQRFFLQSSPLGKYFLTKHKKNNQIKYFQKIKKSKKIQIKNKENI